jgi:hypothetical protein
MREKLNNNPLVQVAILGVLLLGTGFFVMSSMGGGGAEEEAASEAPSTTVTTTTGEAPAAAPGAPEAGAPAETGTTVAAPEPGALAAAVGPPPRPVTEAFAADQTVVLLFVKKGGLDDRIVVDAVDRLSAMTDVATFVVPAGEIARYAAISQGVDVNRVPALVVVRPKDVAEGIPNASVQYGFQSLESVEQAVVDARYEGRTLDYHP